MREANMIRYGYTLISKKLRYRYVEDTSFFIYIFIFFLYINKLSIKTLNIIPPKGIL